MQVVYKWFSWEGDRVVITCEVGPEASRFQTFSLLSYLSSMDSRLEAFNTYPTHDSFAALPGQATALPIM